MKRKTKLKFIAVCLIFTFFCNMTVLAVGSSTAGAVGKFSESLSAKLATATKNEKVSAYVFFKDESTSVLTTMKNSHAELFSTYTAAKGIATVTAEGKTTATTDTQRTAAVDDAKLQEAIEVKRQLYKNHYTTANSAVLEKYCEEADILFVSAYAPMAIVNGTVAELKALALDASVTRIALFENRELISPIETETNRNVSDEPEYIEEHWNKNSRADYTRDALGLTGAGVKIGQVEKGLPYVEDWFLAEATIITNSAYGGEEWESIANENHATNVARILVGNRGVAPDATLYSACAGNLIQFYGAINWLVSQGVNVINMSAGIDGACLYDEFCEYIDLLSIQHDVHFVASAGNYYDGVEEDPTPIPSYNFSRPALAYNAIVVGAYNDCGTVPSNDSQILEKHWDDYLEEYSKYLERTTTGQSYFGAYKPNLVATGNYFWNDFDANGTSYAAPQVTGVIAQLCGYDPALKISPSCIGAILMASCGRKLLWNAESGYEVDLDSITQTYYEYFGGDYLSSSSEEDCANQISNKQGAGKLDAYWARNVVADSNYWNLELSASVSDYTQGINITADDDAVVRVAAFWLMKRYFGEINGMLQLTARESSRWNLIVKNPLGEIIVESTTEHNNYEIVQFVPEISGTYKIIIQRDAGSVSELSYVGLAVCEL